MPPRTVSSAGHREAGTASVELIAVVPFLLLAVLAAVQIALAGQALWSAGVAARAGARAALVGGDATAAARRALPPSLRDGAEVEDAGDGLGAGARCRGSFPGLPRVMVGARAESGAGRWVTRAARPAVELVAALPALLLAALVALQLLAAGYALTLADGAAEAGALALASGGSAAEAARGALPGWAEDDVAVVGPGRHGDGAPAAALAAARARRAARGHQLRQREAGAVTAELAAIADAPDRRWSPRSGRRRARAARRRRWPAPAPTSTGRRCWSTSAARPPRPTLLASAAARRLEERLAAHLPQARVAARGQVCHLAVAADPEGFAAASAAVTVARGALAVLHLPPALLQPLLDGAAGPGAVRRPPARRPRRRPRAARPRRPRSAGRGISRSPSSSTAELGRRAPRPLRRSRSRWGRRSAPMRLLRKLLSQRVLHSSPMAREISQREFRNQSGKIMRELDRGEELHRHRATASPGWRAATARTASLRLHR